MHIKVGTGGPPELIYIVSLKCLAGPLNALLDVDYLSKTIHGDLLYKLQVIRDLLVGVGAFDALWIFSLGHSGSPAKWNCSV